MQQEGLMKPETKPPTTPASQRGTQRQDAVFIGWQKLSSGKVFPLYNVIAAGHPSYGSTVTEQGLQKLHLQIPQTPALQESAQAWLLHEPSVR